MFSNPARHNAIAYEVIRTLPEAVAQLERDGAVRVIGLVNEVVPAAELARHTAVQCAAMAENAPLSITAAKHAIRAPLGDPGHKELRELQAAIDACHGSEDYDAGRAAFGEKRKPQFKGRRAAPHR